MDKVSGQYTDKKAYLQTLRIVMTDTSLADLMETLKVGYLEELPTKVEEIEHHVLELKESQSHDELYRQVHSLKGTAGSYEFHIITSICHYFEDTLLDAIKDDTIFSDEAVSLFLEYIDVLKMAVAELQAGQDPTEQVNASIENITSRTSGEKLDILIIEPSQSYSKLIESSLEEAKANLHFVSDGMNALEYLLHKKYDLLITAMETPALNADSVMSAIRMSQGRNQKIKAILVTSKDHSKLSNPENFSEIIERQAVMDGRLLTTLKKLT